MATFVGTSMSTADFESGPEPWPSVAILLSENGPFLSRWLLDVEAWTDARATTRIGRVLTMPSRAPVVPYGGATQNAASRCVAIASCPGAVRWRVTGRAVPWSPPGYSVSADGLGPVALAERATAEVFIAPLPNAPTSAPGLQAVNADAPADLPIVAMVDAAQIPVGGGATQVLPEDNTRVRAHLRVVGNVDVFLGPAQVTTANGMRLATTDPPLVWTPRRPLWAVSAGGATLSVLLELG